MDTVYAQAPMERVRVLVVDDSPTTRTMLREALALDGGIEVVGEANGGKEAILNADALSPDVVLLDAGMAGKNGYDTCAELRSGGLQMPVLILTNNFVPAEEAQSKAQRAGADGVVVKPFETQALIDRVGQVWLTG